MLKNKVAIITGGSRGIGRGIAKEFGKNGAKVVINYKENEAAALETLKMLEELDAKAIVVQADVSVSADRARIVNAAIAEFGQIDILINNAAIVHFADFLNYDEGRFDAVMQTNIKAPFYLSQLFAKQIIKQNTGGNIINISSVSGFRSCCTLDGNVAAYEVSKAALSMLTKTLANILAEAKIRVNTISPGHVKTDINRVRWEGDPEGWQKIMDKVLLRRAGTTEEIAKAAVYLASDAAAYTTGADIVIDGGLTNYFPV